MEQKAIEHARRRVADASAAAERLPSALEYESFASAWSAFLISANGVWTKLEKGGRMNAKSRQWFGAKKAERRTDPLLQYIHQARNADEHGLHDVAKHVNAAVGIGVRPGHAGFYIDKMVIENGTVRAKGRNLEAMRVDFKPARIELVAVFDDRSSRWYQPPTMHLGNPIKPVPHTVAELAVAYMSALIDEASELPWINAS